MMKYEYLLIHHHLFLKKEKDWHEQQVNVSRFDYLVRQTVLFSYSTSLPIKHDSFCRCDIELGVI